jgi:hypothetical protein
MGVADAGVSHEANGCAMATGDAERVLEHRSDIADDVFDVVARMPLLIAA